MPAFSCALDCPSLSTSTKPTPATSQKTFSHPQWVTGRSLRPNTVQLAEGCMAGDEEAIAIVEAWQFQTSRATKILVVSSDDFGAIEASSEAVQIKEHGVSSLRLNAYSRDLETEEDKELAVVEEKVRTEDLERIKVASTSLTAKEKEVALEDLLDEAWGLYSKAQDAGVHQLWVTLRTFADARSQAYKQASLRVLGREDDFASDFVTHAMNKIMAGKYKAHGAFSHWLKKAYRNFANTKLTALTKEGKRLVGLSRSDEDDDETQGAVEKGYVSADAVFASTQMREAKEQIFQNEVDDALNTLDNDADRSFAEFCKYGKNQKESAKELGESVPTTRKRAGRVRSVLAHLAKSVEGVSL